MDFERTWKTAIAQCAYFVHAPAGSGRKMLDHLQPAERVIYVDCPKGGDLNSLLLAGINQLMQAEGLVVRRDRPDALRLIDSLIELCDHLNERLVIVVDGVDLTQDWQAGALKSARDRLESSGLLVLIFFGEDREALSAMVCRKNQPFYLAPLAGWRTF